MTLPEYLDCRSGGLRQKILESSLGLGEMAEPPPWMWVWVESLSTGKVFPGSVGDMVGPLGSTWAAEPPSSDPSGWNPPEMPV